MLVGVEAQLVFSRAGRGVAMPRRTEEELRPRRVETSPRTKRSKAKIWPMKV